MEPHRDVAKSLLSLPWNQGNPLTQRSKSGTRRIRFVLESFHIPQIYAIALPGISLPRSRKGVPLRNFLSLLSCLHCQIYNYNSYLDFTTILQYRWFLPATRREDDFVIVTITYMRWKRYINIENENVDASMYLCLVVRILWRYFVFQIIESVRRWPGESFVETLVDSNVTSRLRRNILMWNN